MRVPHNMLRSFVPFLVSLSLSLSLFSVLFVYLFIFYFFIFHRFLLFFGGGGGFCFCYSGLWCFIISTMTFECSRLSVSVSSLSVFLWFVHIESIDRHERRGRERKTGREEGTITWLGLGDVTLLVRAPPAFLFSFSFLFYFPFSSCECLRDDERLRMSLGITPPNGFSSQ